MKKLALVLICVGALMGVFHQQVGAMVGLSGYLIAIVFVAAGVALGARAIFGAKSSAFDQRRTEGGFLS